MNNLYRRPVSWFVYWFYFRTVTPYFNKFLKSLIKNDLLLQEKLFDFIYFSVQKILKVENESRIPFASLCQWDDEFNGVSTKHNIDYMFILLDFLISWFKFVIATVFVWPSQSD